MTDQDTVLRAPDVIPVVDIEPLIRGSDPQRVAEALRAASQGLGFIYISGHGIPNEVIDAARNDAFKFFRASESDKQSVLISAKHRGWLAQGGARMHDTAQSDLKESFVWGFQDEHGATPEDHPLRGTNQWPGSLVPTLEEHAMQWFSHAHEVAHHLMRGFALGLQLEEDFFLRTCNKPLSRASFVYYPSQEAAAGSGQFGVAPHTDFGVLTVLCQDTVGGLQVQLKNGEWVQAPPIANTLVVNVADLLARWTANAFISTPHRVINRSGRERLSLVLAFDPNPETVIDARQISSDRNAQYEAPISCGDYLIWRFEKAFDYRNTQALATPSASGQKPAGVNPATR